MSNETCSNLYCLEIRTEEENLMGNTASWNRKPWAEFMISLLFSFALVGSVIWYAVTHVG